MASKTNAKVPTSDDLSSDDTLPCISISMPCYYTQTFKTKPNKTFLVGMNWLITAHKFIRNEVKQVTNDYVVAELTKLNPAKIKGPYEVAFIYHYKTITSDLDNVAPLACKIFKDAIQKYGLVENDHVKFCKKITLLVGEQSKEDPRVDVFIRPYKD